VVPSYNQARFVERTLDSLLAERYPHLELLVIDGASTDGTAEVLRRYAPRLSAWVSEPDNGQADAINKGFRRSSGDVMAWLNSDDMIVPGTLHRVARHFAEHPHVDVIYGDRILVDEEGREIGRWVLPGHSGSLLKWVDFVPQETLFWRRRAWQAIGGTVDERLRFAVDWDILLRFSKAGLKFAHIPEFLGVFRIHATQKTSSVITTTGRDEMTALRRRELGFAPSRTLVILRALPYLLRARWREIRRGTGN
jgi:glycosyltransferase involved in cell wall biosynthesis